MICVSSCTSLLVISSGLTGASINLRQWLAAEAGLFDLLQGTGQRPLGIEYLLAQLIAHRIQLVVDAVAQAVLDVGQAMRGVVGVADGALIGEGDLGQLADAVVVVLGPFLADGAGGQPATRGVAEGGDHAIGVFHGQ